MGLNAGVLDDLDDHDLMLEGIATPPGANSTEYVKVVASNKKGDLMTDDDIAEIPLPDQKVDFIVAKNGLAKVIDLKDIEQTILSQECICRSDVIRINNDFNNIINNVSLESFTEIRSKTNYANTLKLIRNRIAIEENNFVSDFNDFVNNYLPAMSNYLSMLKDVGLAKLQERVTFLITDIKNVESNIFDNKDLVFKVGNEFVNIVKVPFKTVDFSIIECSEPLKPSFSKMNDAMNNIKELVSNKNLSFYIATCLSGKDIKDLNFSKIELTNVLETLTLEDLFTVFSSDTHVNFINELINKINNIISITFAELSKFTNARPEKDYFNEVKDMLIEKDKDFTEIFDSIYFISDLNDKLNRLIFNFSYVIDVLKKL